MKAMSDFDHSMLQISRRSLLVSAGAALAVRATRSWARSDSETGHALEDTIVELRNYTLFPGKRDTLIDLFEHEFVESQEALGAHILGTFRNLDASDHFVWLRSFKDMKTSALSSFYGGPVWHAHSKAANATMIDSNDVHLLHPLGAPLRVPNERPPIGATEVSSSLFVVDIYSVEDGKETEFQARAGRVPEVLATFATEQSPNNFPALPVHKERVFVTLRRFVTIKDAAPIVGLPHPQRTLRLQPTPRSLLR